MELDQFQYFGLLLGVFAVTLPLEFIYGFKVWRNPKRLFKTIAPVAVVMVAWDLFAVHRGHWTFSDRYTVGLMIPGGMPIEEFLFFFIVPAAGISGFEATRHGLARIQKAKAAR